MREIRLSGSEGGAGRKPYPHPQVNEDEHRVSHKGGCGLTPAHRPPPRAALVTPAQT